MKSRNLSFRTYYLFQQALVEYVYTSSTSQSFMIKQLPLGSQGFVTSEQGLGMMSIGMGDCEPSIQNNPNS